MSVYFHLSSQSPILNFIFIFRNLHRPFFRTHDFGSRLLLTVCVLFEYALRASDERTEPEAESKAEAHGFEKDKSSGRASVPLS